MKYTELDNYIVKEENESILLKFLYNTIIGRILLKILTTHIVSKIISEILSLKSSKFIIKNYIKKYKIDMSKYEQKKYNSFNDFFIRKLKHIKKESKQDEFICTAESKLSYYNISDSLIINVKNTQYSIKELLQDEELPREYIGGICLIYRLSPNNYHRYIFIDNGKQDKIKNIIGKLHTVNPIVYDKYKVFSENSREISILSTKNFDKIIQIEVGALCVGKIKNNDNIKFNRYDEKGYFEFGGSTIIQLIKKDVIKINPQIINNSKRNIETKVSIGDVIRKTYT